MIKKIFHLPKKCHLDVQYICSGTPLARCTTTYWTALNWSC